MILRLFSSWLYLGCHRGKQFMSNLFLHRAKTSVTATTCSDGRSSSICRWHRDSVFSLMRFAAVWISMCSSKNISPPGPNKSWDAAASSGVRGKKKKKTRPKAVCLLPRLKKRNEQRHCKCTYLRMYAANHILSNLSESAFCSLERKYGAVTVKASRGLSLCDFHIHDGGNSEWKN